jgi:excisionase family DNA binding protein
MDVDVNDWPTKREAAVQLDVSGRSIDDLLKQGRLKKRIRRGSGPPVVVVDPASIAECRQAECRQAPGASVALARIGDPRLARTRSGIAPSGLEAAFLAFLQSKIPSSLVPVERRIFLTMAESAEYSGLPVAFLRRLIASGKLKALRTGAGWRVSRAELEKSSGTLTDTPEDLSEHELRDLEINRRRRQGRV